MRALWRRWQEDLDDLGFDFAGDPLELAPHVFAVPPARRADQALVLRRLAGGSTRTRGLIAAGLLVPVAMVAAGYWFFYVHKDPPPWAPCEEFLSAGQRAARDDYRVGLKPLAVACALILLALIAKVSIEQRRAAGWPAEITRTSAWLIAGAVVLLALHVWTNTFALHATLAVFGGLAGGEVVLALAAVSAIRFARSRPGFALTWLLAYDWLALVVVLPALLALPLQEGTDYFCINGIV